ncbi:hypothetical protein EVAR_72672_1, partial [Eumeta japonica]
MSNHGQYCDQTVVRSSERLSLLTKGYKRALCAVAYVATDKQGRGPPQTAARGGGGGVSRLSAARLASLIG